MFRGLSIKNIDRMPPLQAWAVLAALLLLPAWRQSIAGLTPDDETLPQSAHAVHTADLLVDVESEYAVSPSSSSSPPTNPPLLPMLTRDCLFSTNHTALGDWRGLFDAPTEHPHALRYHLPPSCTATGDPLPLVSDLATARRVLAGRHLLFIGDSVLRYQARHLIYGLHFGRWLPRFRGNTTAPSPMDQHTYGSWNAMHGNMTVDIGPDSFRCDCFRHSNFEQYETFYYHNREYDINVTFTFHGRGYMGAHYPMGHYYVPLPLAVEDLHTDGRSTLAFSGHNSSAVVDKIVAGLGQVDEVIVAVGGLWSFLAPPFSPVSER